MVAVPDPLTLTGCGPVVHPSEKLLPDTDTASVNVTLMSSITSSAPPLAGVVLSTAGGRSTTSATLAVDVAEPLCTVYWMLSGPWYPAGGA